MGRRAQKLNQIRTLMFQKEREEEGEAKGLKLSVNISGSDVRRPAFHFGC